MELVQWIVPQDEGPLAVGWAPVWADRLPALGRIRGPLRRRGAPLVSRHLAHALVVAGPEAPAHADAPARSIAPGTLSATFRFSVDAPEPRPLVAASSDDLRFAGLVAELVRVVADLSEAAGLPATHLAPLPEHRGVEVALGALGSHGAVRLADALVLLRAAVELCLQARGLVLVDAHVHLADESAPVDGRLACFLAQRPEDRR